MTSSPRTAPRTAARSWRAATRVERALEDVLGRGDRAGLLRALAVCDLFLYVPKEQVDSGASVQWETCEDRAGRWCVAVRTVGERLPRRDAYVVQRTSLAALAGTWPDARFSLCVNPGTPVEVTLPARRLRRRGWRRADERSGRDPGTGRQTALVTSYEGPRTGLAAQALGCGALLAVRNGVLWNDVGDVYDDYALDARLLRESWGTTTAEQWRAQRDALLEARNSPAEPEFVLGVRRRLAGAAGRPVAYDTWRAASAAALDELGAPDLLRQEMQQLIGRILRYEARFRADGLLPPDGFVRSASAYDYGRAINFARWGLGARLCGAEEAREAVLRAGALAGARHTSWADFSAGYALGRVLRFDTEEFGSWYDDVLGPHRILMSDPDSPWLTVPWE